MLRVAWHTGGGDMDTGDLLRAFGSMSFYLYVLNHVWICRWCHLFSPAYRTEMETRGNEVYKLMTRDHQWPWNWWSVTCILIVRQFVKLCRKICVKFISWPEHDSEVLPGVLWRGWDQPLSLFTWHHATSLFFFPTVKTALREEDSGH